MDDRKIIPFNSALETGVRALTILVAAYPRSHDLHRLVQYDYLTVHSADADGPPSLHPALPLRSNELLVRSRTVERGLLLMMSAKLIDRHITEQGFAYVAKDDACTFLSNLTSEYQRGVGERAQWVVDCFDELSAEALSDLIKGLFEAWTVDFQPVQLPVQWELPT